MRVLQVPTPTHGRVLIQDAANGSGSNLLVAFHGYGQNAGDILEEVARIPGASEWTLVAPQALHRFYTRNDQRIVASWMTREDRELAIADNVAYVDRAVEQALPNRDVSTPPRLVFIGFSQGVAMAYRAALLGRHQASGIIALAGDIPPELAQVAKSCPPVLIGAGSDDSWYDSAKLAADVVFLKAHDVAPLVVRFSGGHEWTDEFRAAAGEWLRALA